MADYISAGYDTNMTRAQNIMADPETYIGMQDTQTPAGAANTQDVNSGDSMADLWISTFIRSTNWKPGARGFNIDGKTGNAEFNNVVIRGTIIASDIVGGTITGTTLTAYSFDGVTITASTIEGGTITGDTVIAAGDVLGGTYVRIDGTDNSLSYYLNGNITARLDGSGLAFNTPLGIAAGSISGWGTNQMAIDATDDRIYMFAEDGFFDDWNFSPPDLGREDSYWWHTYTNIVSLANTAAPVANTQAQVYVDVADGDLKVIFSNGTVRTIASN